MECLLILILATTVQGSGQDLADFHVEYPTSNQILFQQKGTLLNSLGFVHVKFKVDMTEPLKNLEEAMAGLRQAYAKEMKRYNQTVSDLTTEDGIVSAFQAGEVGNLFKESSMDTAFSILTLLEMYTRLDKQIRDMLSTIPASYEESDLSVYAHKRTRREILGGIALGAAIYNGVRISSLESQFSNLTGNYNKLVDSVDLLSKKHQQLAVDTQIIIRLSKLLLQGNRRLLASSLSLSNRLSDTIANIASIIENGRQRRVSSRLIHGTGLIELYNQVEKIAEKLKCQMVLSNPAEIYETESSYAFEENSLAFTIIVHIPLAPVSEKLSLWEHIKFPLMESFDLNATVVPIDTNFKYLGISPNPGNPDLKGVPSHKYRVMNEAEFQSCTVIRGYYLCGQRNSLRTDVGDSCLGSLWLRNENLIRQNCEITISRFQEYTAKLSPNSFIIMSPASFSRTLSCGSDFIKSVRFEKQTIISLPQNCKLDLKRHQLTTDLNLIVDFKVENFAWRYSGAIFDGIINGDTDLVKFVRKVTQNRGMFGLQSLADLKFFYETPANQLAAIWDYISNLSIFSGFSNFFIFIAIIGVIVAVYFVISKGWFRKCFSRSRNHPPEVPYVRPIRASFRVNRNRDRDPLLGPQNLFANPPPYAVAIDMGDISRDGEKSGEPFAVDFVETKRPSNTSKCVVRGVMDEDMSNFVCSLHNPNGECSGYFKE